jgi:hypothetical protein
VDSAAESLAAADQRQFGCAGQALETRFLGLGKGVRSRMPPSQELEWKAPAGVLGAATAPVSRQSP